MNQPELEVRLLPAAEDDLIDIISYVAADNSAAAENLLDKIEENLANLSIFPYMGKELEDERLAGLGYRVYVIGKYLAFYTVERKSVLVHRTIHGARDYSRLL